MLFREWALAVFVLDSFPLLIVVSALLASRLDLLTAQLNSFGRLLGSIIRRVHRDRSYWPPILGPRLFFLHPSLALPSALPARTCHHEGRQREAASPYFAVLPPELSSEDAFPHH